MGNEGPVCRVLAQKVNCGGEKPQGTSFGWTVRVCVLYCRKGWANQVVWDIDTPKFLFAESRRGLVGCD